VGGTRRGRPKGWETRRYRRANAKRKVTFASGLEWFRTEYALLAAPDSGVALYETTQEAGDVMWVPEGWSYARLFVAPSVGFGVEVGALNRPRGDRNVAPALFDDDDDAPKRISYFARDSDPAYKESDFAWVPDDAFLRQLESLETTVKARIDAAAAKMADDWAAAKFESGEWIRPERIAEVAAEAVAQVDEFLPPPPPESIAAKEPSEMLKRWAASPFNPKKNPAFLNEPESD
jgi:hypothetical protein